MPLFNNQIRWRAIGATVMLELIILFVLGYAVVGYVEWSSGVAVAEFMSATRRSAADLNRSGVSSTPVQSPKDRTGCPLGKGLRPTAAAPWTPVLQPPRAAADGRGRAS
jgi:hypothetical protein